jgi:hypothetical protein
MALATLLAAPLAALPCATPAQAQLPDPVYQQAEATVRQYATDMMKVVPCAYAGMPMETPEHDMVDTTWGPPAAQETLESLAGRGATPAQIDHLKQVLADTYHPVWSVADVRQFGRDCAPVILAISMFKGIAAPLSMRPPFAAP